MNEINDECCVCFEQEMALSTKDGHFNSYRLLCCGTLICSYCKKKLDKETEETGKDWDCLVCRSPRPKTAKERFDMALTRVKEGRVWAFAQIGEKYQRGIGVSQSFAKAFEYYSLGAAKGEAGCQYQIGCMYEKGEGVKQNYERAFKFYTLAAEQGFPGAQTNLAACYIKGHCVDKSEKKAFEWSLLAAQNGETSAQSQLGSIYFQGLGTEQDYEKAIYYHTLAAEGNNKDSQFIIAAIYSNGIGVEQSIVKAIYWFKQFLKDNKDEKRCAKVRDEIDSMSKFVKGHCSSCENEDGKFSLYCGRCLSAYYCNKTCKAKHWKIGGHKQECKEP